MGCGRQSQNKTPRMIIASQNEVSQLRSSHFTSILPLKTEENNDEILGEFDLSKPDKINEHIDMKSGSMASRKEG